VSGARLGRVEDEVKLAHALEAAVQRLHVHCGAARERTCWSGDGNCTHPG
jgi:hypothetical protein